MLYPLLDVAFAGVIWYQGENNAIGEESVNDYEEVLQTLIGDWRRAFDEPELPFLIVQLPDFGREGGIFNFKRIREAQRAMLGLPAIGLAITINVGDPDDIHPKNKHDVGDRLARWALVDVYGKDGNVKSGPIVKDATLHGYTITVSFETFGSRLGNSLNKPGVLGFEVVGTKGDILQSPARIVSDDTVEVLVPADWDGPVSLRYAWRESPKFATLLNLEGLPASPFEIAVRR
jgi:sialate O-acetylesterase